MAGWSCLSRSRSVTAFGSEHPSRSASSNVQFIGNQRLDQVRVKLASSEWR